MFQSKLFRYHLLFLLLILFVSATTAGAVTLQRGPYLQLATPTGLVVKWRTDSSVTGVVRYGLASDSLTQSASEGGATRDHEVAIGGLQPATRYYYSVGDGSGALAGDASHTFVTAPAVGVADATRIWVIGDSGTADNNARAVRDAYKTYTAGQETDLWLMLGDNAYNSGTDNEYQDAVFDMYPQMLRQVALWSTLGNHDGYSADSGTQTGPYYDIFTLPTQGEAGGLASGTEAYYSFDYANIHFVCLDSYDTNRASNGAMMTWLANDLAATQQDWIIAFWHHPPYTKGSHDSDSESQLIQMRENALPILESYGVDLVLSGHSHSYERSYLLNGHYGKSSDLSPEQIVDNGDGREDGDGAYDKVDSGAGAVYAVAGSSGKTSGGSLNHPAMFISLNTLGSMVLDVNDNRLDAVFLNASGEAKDHFTLVKGPDTTPPTLQQASAPNTTSVVAAFSEALEPGSAETTDNFAIDNGISVQQAALQPDGRSVLLTVSALTENVSYTLTVNNVADLAGNLVAPGSQAAFQYYNQVTLAFQDGAAPTTAYTGTRDTYIRERNDNDNYGNADELLLDGDDPSGSGDDMSTLLAWDLSAIPPGATILAARVSIDVFDPSGDGYGVYELKQDWDEATATWKEYADGGDWDVAGALGGGDRGSALLAGIYPSSAGDYSFDLNADGLAVVQAWVNQAKPNHGFIIGDRNSDDGLDFVSSDAPAIASRPRLTVTYAPPAPDTEAPSVPSGLQAGNVTADSIALNWSPSTDDVIVAGYHVYRDGGLVGTTAGTSYVDGGLALGTTYTYEVTAFDATGNESGASEAVNATTAAFGCTVAGDSDLDLGDNKIEWDLTNTGSETITLDRIEATWPNEQGNLKRIKLDGDEIYNIQQPPPSAVIDGGWSSDSSKRRIDPGDRVTLKIEFTVKYKGDTDEDYAVTVDFAEICTATIGTPPVPDMEPPTAPGGLQVNGVTTDSVSLGWNASTDNVGVSGYRVYRDGAAAATTTGVTYTDNGLTPATAYGYQVTALDEAGNESAPSGVTATTATPPPEDTEAPTPPSNLAVTGVTANSISLEWDAATDNVGVTEYRVYQGGTKVATVTGTTFQDNGLTADTDYTYQVKAFDAAENESVFSNSVTATTESSSCTVTDDGNLELGDNKIEWELTNQSDESVTIDRIQVGWPNAQGKLKKIKLDGDEIYRIQRSPPSAVIDGNWRGNASKRQIDAGDRVTLKIEFTVKYKGDTASDYTIGVDFAEGCAVDF